MNVTSYAAILILGLQNIEDYFVPFFSSNFSTAPRMSISIWLLISHYLNLRNMFYVHNRLPIYRRVAILDWLVFYIVDTESQRVDIHRIIDSRMRLPERLLECLIDSGTAIKR